VELVEHEDSDPVEQRVALQSAQQHAVRHVPEDACSARRRDRSARRVRRRPPNRQLRSEAHAPRRCPRRDPRGSCTQTCPTLPPGAPGERASSCQCPARRARTTFLPVRHQAPQWCPDARRSAVPPPRSPT
jgi:hypothetical protein